ncbi:MAG TPA: family 20 glycosylhydrolase [Armatimonadota bacterium]|jgi:hexosaminidase
MTHLRYRGAANLLPPPVSHQAHPGRLTLSSAGRVVAAEAALLPLAEVFAHNLAVLTGHLVKMAAAEGEAGPGDVLLALDPALTGEQYTLEVGDRAVVRGGSYAGVCRGLAALAQSVVCRRLDRYIPGCRVADEPYAGFRALMVDVARQPHTLSGLKQLVVMCWYYRIAYLQLHLSDVEGFAFPSTAFPRLATAHALSLDQWRELEAFATVRGVTILPELDVPGHAGEGLKRLCPTHPRTGVQVINPVSERTFEVLDTLIGELCEVFRATPYFHLGADEVAYQGWAHCRDCARELKRLGLTDLRELYRRFIVRMNDVVRAHGKRMIVWEGFAAEGVTPIPPEVIVQFFDVMYLQPEEAMAQGHDIINASWGPLYVAGPHAASPVEMIHQWHPFLFGSCGLWETPDALDHAPALGATTAPGYFYHRPFPGTYFPRVRALPEYRDQMLGAMLCSWGLREDQELPLTRRRLPAMAERLWNPHEQRSYLDFVRRLDLHEERLELLLEDVLAADQAALPGMSPFVRSLRVSAVQSPAKLRDLAAPPEVPLLRRDFPEDFLDLHADFASAGRGVAYFACRLHCAEAMRLAVCLGYDGPVRVWLDGRPAFTDLLGSNPARADEADVPWEATAGEHEVVIALDAADGNACGVFLRFQRQDRPDLLPEILG